eukprot:3845801-Pleurochrysis_carterae.AAC.1
MSFFGAACGVVSGAPAAAGGARSACALVCPIGSDDGERGGVSVVAGGCNDGLFACGGGGVRGVGPLAVGASAAAKGDAFGGGGVGGGGGDGGVESGGGSGAAGRGVAASGGQPGGGGVGEAGGDGGGEGGGVCGAARGVCGVVCGGGLWDGGVS